MSSTGKDLYFTLDKNDNFKISSLKFHAFRWKINYSPSFFYDVKHPVKAKSDHFRNYIKFFAHFGSSKMPAPFDLA